jgi:beta-1,4-N-acetylglucosaminyltransferase
MIFLTVGSEFPFDRLVRAVDYIIDSGKFSKQVFAQVGNSRYKPRHMSWETIMERGDYIQRLKDSDGVIAHAGMGTILACLELQKPLLVMPRQAKFGEVVNDHQLGTAFRFEEMGQILVAQNETELEQHIGRLLKFRPRVRQEGTQMIINCVREFLDKLEVSK